MIYGVQAIVEAVCTLSAINAQLGTTKTEYGATVSNVATLANGHLVAPKDAGGYPAVLYWVGGEGVRGESTRFGKQDASVPVTFGYYSRTGNLATSLRETAITIEALALLAMSLQGQQVGTTGHQRQVINLEDVTAQVGSQEVDGVPVRMAGWVRCTVKARTIGL